MSRFAAEPSARKSPWVPDLAGRLIITVIALLLIPGHTALCDDQRDLQRLQRRATTDAYRRAAFEILLAEANQIARELELPERLPIKRSDLLETWINTPQWADSARQFGFVCTSNYYYYASVGNKLASIVPNFGKDDLRRPAYMEALRKRYLMPKAQMDTNAAYAMATQWLAKAGIDVKALERDAERVDITTWEIGSNFVPIYVVRWQQLVLYRGEDGPPKFDPIGSIHFVAPERRILQMDVNRAKYIARNALTVPDRDRLLQQTDDPEVRELWFTTEPYKAAAMKTMLGEVNWAARSLGLPEKLPIEPSALRDVVIGTPYTADHQGSFATVFTEKYSYRATQKLTLISRAYSPGEEQHHFASIRTRYTMPLSRVNTNAVYCLATQWLAALSVDLRRLEADHPSRITVPWVLGGQFLPLYTVEWSKPIEHSSRRDVAAKVEVLEPERSLEQLVIEKPEYMMRPPITVPDRDKLLRQSNAK